MLTPFDFSLMNALDDAVCILEQVPLVTGGLRDYRYVFVNSAFRTFFNTGDLAGRSVRENFPGKAPIRYDDYDHVLDTGIPKRFERELTPLHKTIEMYVTCLSSSPPNYLMTIMRDVTEQSLSEAARQQQEIFRVTLSTQEEERNRMAESLHNGLGQLLYGIKISMTTLTPQHAANNPGAFLKAKTYTEDLLTEAIQDTRRISHELMPASLTEFGLKTAIMDVCEQLQGVLIFTCRFTLKELRLEKYLELAVFRTVQELMINAVKHAKATKGKVAITQRVRSITIKVSDNGQGMERAKINQTGIGLPSIRSKINLLNGSVNIESLPGKGTKVTVTIPILVS